MNMNEYQIEAGKTAVYPNRSQNLLYPLLGLLGETGELIEKILEMIACDQDVFNSPSGNHVYGILLECSDKLRRAEIVKKYIRDGKDPKDYMVLGKQLSKMIDEKKHDELCFELGDLLWYLSQTAFELGVKLDNVAQWNLNKLSSRKERNKIHGSGDKR